MYTGVASLKADAFLIPDKVISVLILCDTRIKLSH